MGGRLKPLLLSTSALVGFALVPTTGWADPVTTTILVSSAVTAGASTAFAAVTGTLVGKATTAFFTKFAIQATAGFVLNALTPKPSMPSNIWANKGWWCHRFQGRNRQQSVFTRCLCPCRTRMSCYRPSISQW